MQAPRDLSPLPPDVWQVWFAELSKAKLGSVSIKRAFVGKSRYDRMMREVTNHATLIQIDTKLRTPFICSLPIVIDYSDRERLEFQ